jgi:hypothetical protein
VERFRSKADSRECMCSASCGQHGWKHLLIFGIFCTCLPLFSEVPVHAVQKKTGKLVGSLS